MRGQFQVFVKTAEVARRAEEQDGGDDEMCDDERQIKLMQYLFLARQDQLPQARKLARQSSTHGQR
jgi:hypothetical protein